MVCVVRPCAVSCARWRAWEDDAMCDRCRWCYLVSHGVSSVRLHVASLPFAIRRGSLACCERASEREWRASAQVDCGARTPAIPACLYVYLTDIRVLHTMYTFVVPVVPTASYCSGRINKKKGVVGTIVRVCPEPWIELASQIVETTATGFLEDERRRVPNAREGEYHIIRLRPAIAKLQLPNLRTRSDGQNYNEI